MIRSIYDQAGHKINAKENKTKLFQYRENYIFVSLFFFASSFFTWCFSTCLLLFLLCPQQSKNLCNSEIVQLVSGSILELYLRKVGIPTLSKSIPTLRTGYINSYNPLYNSRIVRYNSRIGGQSRNSYFAQVQFRN